MKKLFILLFSFTSITALAQNIAIKKIGVIYSQDRTYLPEKLFVATLNLYSSIEQSNNFTAGLTSEVSLLSRLSIRTGVTYSNRDFTGYFTCFQCEFVAGSTPFAQRETVQQRYLNVPVAARYYFINKTFSVYSDLGVTGNFLIENTTKVYKHDITKVNSNSFLLSGEAGVGVSYTFFRNVEVSVSAVYRHGLTEYIKTDDMEFRSFGVVGGVSYRL